MRVEYKGRVVGSMRLKHSVISLSSLVYIFVSFWFELVVFFVMMKIAAAPLLLATASAVHPMTIKLQGRTAKSSVDVKLTNWWNITDFQWYGKISVGTPPQQL